MEGTINPSVWVDNILSTIIRLSLGKEAKFPAAESFNKHANNLLTAWYY